MLLNEEQAIRMNKRMGKKARKKESWGRLEGNMLVMCVSLQLKAEIIKICCHAQIMSSLLVKIKLVSVGAERASKTCAKGGGLIRMKP